MAEKKRAILPGFRSGIIAKPGRAFSGSPVRPSVLRLVSLLVAVISLGACAAQPQEQRDNLALRQTIRDAVPNSWRDAANSTGDIAPLTVTPAVRDFAHSAVRSNDTQREQMISLTHAIIDSGGVGLKYIPDATNTASEALQSGQGNCMGFSNLLIASARELGLNASYELVSHDMRWNRVDGALVGSLHVRVISFSSGRRMVFDFYPVPLQSGFSTELLSDQAALAHHLNNLAADLMHEGEDAKAYGLLIKAIESTPDIAFIWSNLGILLSRNDLDLLAEAVFKEALSISPDTMSALSNLQFLYVKQGRDAEAEKMIARLERHRARNPYYHFSLGKEAYEQADYKGAVRHFKEAIDLKNNDSQFYTLLSKSYEELGKERAALRASKKAYAINNPKPVASYTIKRSQAETGSHITRR